MGCEYYVLFTCGGIRPLSQYSSWAALLEPSWCVGVQTWLLRKERIPSIPKAMVLESRSLLRLRCQLGVEQLEDNEIWESILTRTRAGGGWVGACVSHV